MNKFALAFFFLIIALSAAGCEKIAAFLPAKTVKPEGTVIAQVDKYSVTLEQLDKDIESMNALNALYFNIEAKKLTKEEKIAFLKDNVVPKFLLFKEALARKMDKQPKVLEDLFNTRVQMLSQEFLKRETGDISAAPQEIEAFYSTYKDRFRQDEERRVREILVSSEEEAKEILIDLLKGADFAATAASRSKSQTASKGGDIGYIKRGQLGEELIRFTDTAFSLERGQISPVIRDKKGYYLIRIEDVKGGQLTPLNEVWDQVKNAVVYIKQQQKVQELKDALTKKAKIEIYEEKVK